MGEVSVQVTEPRRRPVRRPGPSQIKMYGFCRPFRAMFTVSASTGSNGILAEFFAPLDSTAPKLSNCTNANPEMKYVPTNEVLRNHKFIIFSKQIGLISLQYSPPPPRSTIKTEHWPPLRVKRHRQGKLRHGLVSSRDHGMHFAVKLYSHRAIPLLQLRVRWPRDDSFDGQLRSESLSELSFAFFRHNALFVSSFPCSLIAVELHCDAWCSREVHCSLCVDLLFVCAAVKSLWSLFHEFVQNSNSSNPVQEPHKWWFTCCKGHGTYRWSHASKLRSRVRACMTGTVLCVKLRSSYFSENYIQCQSTTTTHNNEKNSWPWQFVHHHSARNCKAKNCCYDFVHFQIKLASPLPLLLNRLRLEMNDKLLPWPKKLRNCLHVAQARDLSSMHAPMFGLRGCLNFFGKGSNNYVPNNCIPRNTYVALAAGCQY